MPWSEETRAAHAARMRALNADPAFASARADAARTPEARAQRSACMRRSWETGALSRPDIPEGYEESYVAARRKLGAAEALALVQAEARRDAKGGRS